MKIVRMSACLLVGTLALVGCAGTSSTDGETSVSSAGLGAVPGFDPAEGTIRLGNILPLSGPIGQNGKDLLLGTQLYVDRINAAGGIAGKYPIELVNADSKYDPQAAIAAYNGMADDVVMVPNLLGSAITGAVLPQAETDDMLLILTSDTSAYLRQANALNVRPTYEGYTINGLAYLAENGGQDKTVCSLLQDDAFGENVKAGLDFAVDKLDLKYTEEVRFATTNTDYTPQISQLKAGGCEIVVYAGTPAATLPAMTSAVQLDFAPQWLTGPSGFTTTFIDSPIADYLTKTWTISSFGASWGDESVPGMKQLMADYEEFGPKDAIPAPPSYISGYQSAMAAEVLLTKAVERGDLSHKSLLDLSLSPDVTVDFMGLAPAIEMAPAAERRPPTAVSIFVVDTSVVGGLRMVETGFDSDAAKAFEY